MTVNVRKYLREYYEYRGILRSLVNKNLFGRYKNPVVSFSWHFVLPIVMMGVYYLVFNTIRVNSVPEFWVFMSSGLFPFMFMMDNLNRGPEAVTSNSEIINKMYFPRSMLVVAEIISSFIVMLIGYVIIFAGMLLTGHSIEFPVVVLPFFLILMAIFVTGYVLFLASVNVYIRDIKYLVNTLSMVFYFITPLYFTMDDVSGIFENVIAINPFAYYVQAYEQMVYYGVFPDQWITVMCVLMPILSVIIGGIIYHKLRHGFIQRL